MKNNDPNLKPNDILMRTTTRHLLVGKREERIFRDELVPLYTLTSTEKALGTQPSSSRMLADETMSESFIGGMMMIRSYEEHLQ
jgi:hypothetical protein